MEYRHLGRSGLQVSVVGIGCNNFGGRIDADQTAAVVNKALDLGINFFDTADVYGNRGMSEEYLGRALQGKRRDVIIATKFRSPMGEGPHWSGGSRRYIMDAVEDSLRRLGTDYIDLYQIHNPDPSTPIEETLRALDDLVRSGKVRYIGHSNFSAAQSVEAAWVAKTEHLTPFISLQNHFNLLNRLDAELIDVCGRYGLGILPYFPLASGFLTGKYRPDQPAPEGTRLAGPMGGRMLTERNYETLRKLETIAEENGRSMLELAMSWLAQQPQVASVIAGATKPEQVEQNAEAVHWTMTPEILAAIDEAAPAPSPRR
jgi:aryl-alcohol dehydrogenase-like predicted oxidoreductase